MSTTTAIRMVLFVTCEVCWWRCQLERRDFERDERFWVLCPGCERSLLCEMPKVRRPALSR